MHEKRDEIRSYYNANPQKEWDRLKKKHPYEKYITIRMMDRYIKPGDRILDIGGGPGHYAIHYAKQGHSVTLLDLSDENVRFAKKKARQYGVKIAAEQGDATDLSRFADDSFDTVFLMGPLYHLMNEESRILAIEEAKRVLKPGGVLLNYDAEYAKGFHKYDQKENLAHVSVDDSLVEECHDIYHMLSISSLDRPEWDVKTLKELGFSEVEADRFAGDRLYAVKDQFYMPDRMFCLPRESVVWVDLSNWYSLLLLT